MMSGQVQCDEDGMGFRDGNVMGLGRGFEKGWRNGDGDREGMRLGMSIGDRNGLEMGIGWEWE